MSDARAADTATGLRPVIDRFIAWLDQHGPWSYDHQTFYSGPVGGRAKRLYYKHRLLGTVAVAPLVFCEAFAPGTRRWLGPRLRFPIADAHYAMGFLRLASEAGDAYHRRAVPFLEALEQSRAPGYARHGWGYPFDWVTQNGTIAADTPFITSTPYAYEAFHAAFALDRCPRWRDVCHSIASHAADDIRAFPVAEGGASAGYSPDDTRGGVINAAAYRAWLLALAADDFGIARYWDLARDNLAFVLAAQRPDGSWPYAVGDTRGFVDHFHTCFVLKALAKITSLHPGMCDAALSRGVDYYVGNLFDSGGLPKPFAVAPRLTVYRRELYDYAECLNVCVLLGNSYPALRGVGDRVLDDLLRRWVKPDGSFRSRELVWGWDNVPMHRWAQSQMFRSLAFVLRDEPTITAPQPAAYASASTEH